MTREIITVLLDILVLALLMAGTLCYIGLAFKCPCLEKIASVAGGVIIGIMLFASITLLVLLIISRLGGR